MFFRCSSLPGEMDPIWRAYIFQNGWLNHQLGVSKSGGTAKSSILIEISITNHPFWGISIFGNTPASEHSLATPFFFSTNHLPGAGRSIGILMRNLSMLSTLALWACTLACCYRNVFAKTKQVGGFEYFLFSPLLGEDSHFD